MHTRYPILANTFLVASLAAECDRQRSQKALEMYWGLLLWTGRLVVVESMFQLQPCTFLLRKRLIAVP